MLTSPFVFAGADTVGAARCSRTVNAQRREHLSVEHGLQQRIADLTMQLKIAEDKRRDLLEQNNEKVSILESLTTCHVR